MARVLLLNPLSLLGSEIREAMDRRRDLWEEVKLATNDAEQVGTLTEVAGAAALVESFAPGEGAPCDLLVVCGDPLPTPEELRRLGEDTTVLFAYGSPGGAEALPIVAGVNVERIDKGRWLVSPPPPVVLLASVLAPLHDLGLQRVVASILLPASDRGQKGLDELLNQTRGLLAFEGEMPKEIWGEQLAFNVLPAAGGGAAIARSLASVLGVEVPVAVQLLQAGVFHGLTASLWVELSAERSADEVREAIASLPFVETADEPSSVGPVAAGTSDQILLGRVEPDSAGAGGFWIWVVMDNLTRGGALNAIAVAEALLAPIH
jgi:aspartate-semialdehyde dehydrogenase